MIVDSSAIIACLRVEPEAAAIRHALSAAPRSRASTPTLLESSLVAGPTRQEDLDDFLAASHIETVAFDAAHLRAAREAWVRYGKGSGSPARLNFGDCMSYALAKVAGEPLLFKGDGFTHTDIVSALTP
jgi:ribonuclease VapC